MNKINLIYWNSANFGDALSPMLVEEFSDCKVQFKDISLSRKQRLYTLLSLNFKRSKNILLPRQTAIASIGSIISWVPKGTLIWGSGFMNKSETFRGGQVFAVRGKLTAKKLEQQGLSGCKVYGDPALLLPLWLQPSPPKKHKLCIIPHWKEIDDFVEKYGSRYHVIDLRTKNIEKIIDEICACTHVLSTSLHGLIVAHAYDIPALWIKKGYIDTDGFKFKDYFSSVDIPFYDGFDEIENILSTERTWEELFNQHQDKTKINNSLAQLQINLLKAAPFRLKQKYQNYIDINAFSQQQ